MIKGKKFLGVLLLIFGFGQWLTPIGVILWPVGGGFLMLLGNFFSAPFVFLASLIRFLISTGQGAFSTTNLVITVFVHIVSFIFIILGVVLIRNSKRQVFSSKPNQAQIK